MTERCRVCGTVLTEENWKEWMRVPKVSRNSVRGVDRRCWECVKAYNRDYTMKWRGTEAGQRHKMKHDEWRRKNLLGTRHSDGKVGSRMVEGKRPYPDPALCEMCDEPKTRLVYHHWNDADYSQGLWICQGCHNVAHTWEDKRARQMRYRALKQMVGAKPYAGMVTK